MLEQLSAWDRELFVFLNSLGIEEYDGFWIFVTQIKHWTPVYLLFFLLFFKWYPLKKALLGIAMTLATFLITLGVTEFVKNTVARLRPNNTPELAEVIRILQTPDNFSFFSGHSSVSFAVTTFVVLAFQKYSRWVYLFYVWPLLFISSRIFVGVHYPGDILVGALVGVLIAFLLWRLIRPFLTKADSRPDSVAENDASFSS